MLSILYARVRQKVSQSTFFVSQQNYKITTLC
jgi:hypothetical protein